MLQYGDQTHPDPSLQTHSFKLCTLEIKHRLAIMSIMSVFTTYNKGNKMIISKVTADVEKKMYIRVMCLFYSVLSHVVYAQVTGNKEEPLVNLESSFSSL